MDALRTQHCQPCEGGVPSLDAERVRALLGQLHADWKIADHGRTIVRELRFGGYHRALGFANAVAWIAIQEGHHPDITVGYGYCRVSYTTHAIGGLSENDFICAAKVDGLLGESGEPV